MNKYLVIAVIVLGIGLIYAYLNSGARTQGSSSSESYPVSLSEQEWKERLSPEAFRVLREEGTERPNTSPLNKEKRDGAFQCAGCGQEVFLSEHKFDSGTGWPSFFQPAGPEAVGTSTDYKLVVPRTEVHCSRCGGHLGHVFSDGPKPTGKRYCINGVALKFEPAPSDG